MKPVKKPCQTESARLVRVVASTSAITEGQGQGDKVTWPAASHPWLTAINCSSKQLMEGRGALADCYGHKSLLGVAYATLPAILIDGQGTVAWARSPQVPRNHRMSPSSCSIFIFITTPIIYMRCLTHLPEPGASMFSFLSPCKCKSIRLGVTCSAFLGSQVYVLNP